MKGSDGKKAVKGTASHHSALPAASSVEQVGSMSTARQTGRVWKMSPQQSLRQWKGQGKAAKGQGKAAKGQGKDSERSRKGSERQNEEKQWKGQGKGSGITEM